MVPFMQKPSTRYINIKVIIALNKNPRTRKFIVLLLYISAGQHSAGGIFFHSASESVNFLMWTTHKGVVNWIGLTN